MQTIKNKFMGKYGWYMYSSKSNLGVVSFLFFPSSLSSLPSETIQADRLNEKQRPVQSDNKMWHTQSSIPVHTNRKICDLTCLLQRITVGNILTVNNSVVQGTWVLHDYYSVTQTTLRWLFAWTCLVRLCYWEENNGSTCLLWHNLAGNRRRRDMSATWWVQVNVLQLLYPSAVCN